jgi:hypothetical protein
VVIDGPVLVDVGKREESCGQGGRAVYMPQQQNQIIDRRFAIAIQIAQFLGKPQGREH